MIAGKLEVAIKINELRQPKAIKNGWQRFYIDCDGRIITITVKPKIYNKLIDGASNYPHWVAAITGKRGQQADNGFVLEEPNIQVFERKPKPEATATLVLLEPG
ncbi:MAG: fertility inhibition FinO-like protein [Nostoc sp.]|uniref:fertility inhibition FinO-like protein n=1 Tax=Nostoc sp. TaxID=1180 RepID=UPI002FF5A68C